MHIDTKPKQIVEPIAVIGVSCRFPGAPDLPGFARLLMMGTDAVTQIPADRWSRDSYLHPDPRQRGKTYTMAAGVIDGVDQFDAAFFGISPREAAQMDPQQRLLLELTHEAFEDAGVTGRQMAGTRTGVFIGGSSLDYLALRLGDPAAADAYFMTGSTLSTLSNRISYIFDLKGPSFTVDTACSSSLVALHVACAAMRRGEIDLALVGGVNLLLAPQSFVGFSRASMLSPRGRCHAFAEGADGYVRAEGGGVILLKPLEAALADADPILCVIEGTGINSDGRTAGLSLPSQSAQAALLREVYAASSVDPSDLVYVEAHGTGTAVGDPIEAGALGEVLGRNRTTRLPIGSVKTNIGHLEAGSGMAGLLKAMLVLRDGTIPASLHCDRLNPAIDFDALNLVLARENMPAAPTGSRAAVGVNSFGFGGTNAHAVLASVPPPAADNHEVASELPPLLISARSEAALTSLARLWRDRLDGMGAHEAGPLLRGAARGREHHGHRLAATGADPAELVAALDTLGSSQPSHDLAIGTAARPGKTAFVYSGNGSQWAGMALDALQDRHFRRAMDEIDAELSPRLGWSIIDRLHAIDADTMRRTDVAQPLLFAIQAAALPALAEKGVVGAAHLGHSVGEVAAAMAAGALSLADAAQVIVARSVAQQRTSNAYGMAVLSTGPDGAKPLLAAVPELEIAAINAGNSITVAGPRPALARLERLSGKQRVGFVMLDLDYGFHSAAMNPVRDSLLHDLDGITPVGTRSPFYSTVFGKLQDGAGLGPDYWWRNVRAPVRFADGLGAAIDDGHTILIEIGPNPVLLTYLRDGLRHADIPGRALPTLSRRVQDGAPFHRIAGQAHVAGHDISGAAMFDGPMSLADLPRYPWQRERHWYEPTDEATDTISARQDHGLLGFRRGSEPNLWFNTLDLAAQPWLADHAVDGTPLLPAAAMVEMALAAARARHPEAAALDVLDLEIVKPMLLEQDMARETRFSVTGDRGVFELASRARLSGDAWTIHASGRLGAGSTAGLSGLSGGRSDELPLSSMAGPDLYALTKRLGLDYGPHFQTVARVSVHGSGSATATLVPAPLTERAGYLTDPARLDGALQGLVALAAGEIAGLDVALLPWRIGRVRLGRTDGAAIASAQLRVNRVGPRSVSADIALLDADDTVIATLTDCWFTRMAADAADDLAAATYHTVGIAHPRAETDSAPAETPFFPEPASEEDEAALLTEAYIAMAAYDAVLGMAGPTIDPAQLVAAGRLHPGAKPLLHAMLAWLERDGLATGRAGVWTLAGSDDLPEAAEIWRSVLSGAPEAVAEAALVGAVGEALPAILAAGPTAMPGGLAALTTHLQLASPTARSAMAALIDAAGRIAAAWPDRPLRVLEVGAVDESLTARLVEALARSGAAIHYVGLLAPGANAAAIERAVAALPEAAVVEWDDKTPIAGGGFDLVIGLFALTRASMADRRDVLPQLQVSLAPGGLLLLAEPRPNRVWDLRFGADPAWWRAGTQTTPLQDGSEWQQSLQAAGFHEATAAPVQAAVWGVTMLSARAHGARRAAAPRIAPEAGLLIVALPGAPLADAIARTMLAQGRAATMLPLEAAATGLAKAAPPDGDIVFVVPQRSDVTSTIAQAGATIAHCASALAETTGLRFWVIVSTPTEHALIAAALRGVTRVMANEAPNIVPHFIDVDPALTVEDAASRVAAELTAPDAETELSLSTDGRAVTRVRRGFGAPAAPSTAPAFLQIGRPGLLDTLGWQPAESRTPGEAEVGIAVEASGLNFRDLMWSLGLLPDEALLDGLAGATLGLECTGVVTAVGPGVTHVAVGDRVMAIAPACLSTAVIAPAQAVIRLPDSVSFAAGATVPVAFLTVCYALGTLANLQPGERVLIHGGAGGVGLAAIQYARHRGAEIFASAGSPAKRALLRLLGVDHVLDSRSLDFADDIRALTGGQGVDVVLNSLAGEAMERSVGILRPFGRFLELGKRDLYGNTPLGLRALRHNVSYFAIDADQLPVQRPDIARRVFAEIAVLLEQGTLRPLPHRLFGFGAATDAFRLMQSAAHIGKIVLVPEADGEPGGVKLARRPAPWTANPEGTFIVTGGLSGFGLETARWLVGLGVRSLALLSRQGPATPGAAAAMAGFVTQGVLARAFACDVSDAAAVATVLTDIRATMLPITGVIHAAMVLDDALLPQLNAERFQHVLGPKLGGARLLDRLTRSDPIDTFVLFSSITTLLGNPGQANYVAANAAMEALAAARHAEGLPALSVGWGPIGDVGYLSREKAVSDMLVQRMGAAHLDSQHALSLLPTLLASGRPHVDVARLRWGPLRAHLPHLGTPIFTDLLRGQQADAGQVDFAKLLADSTPDQARALVGDALAAEVAGITKAPLQQIDLDRSLTDLGMDSLMAVELRIALERRFGASLPLLSLADGASIGSIAARIMRHLTATSGPNERALAAAAILDRYEEVAPEEEMVLEEMVLAELNPGSQS